MGDKEILSLLPGENDGYNADSFSLYLEADSLKARLYFFDLFNCSLLFKRFCGTINKPVTTPIEKPVSRSSTDFDFISKYLTGVINDYIVKIIFVFLLHIVFTLNF
jgi:hypothetical protein